MATICENSKCFKHAALINPYSNPMWEVLLLTFFIYNIEQS